MPKIKTKSSVKKRFKLTGTGKIRHKNSYTSHMMSNKPKSMKRKARHIDVVAQADEKRILRWMPNNSKQRKRAQKEPNQAPEHRSTSQKES